MVGHLVDTNGTHTHCHLAGVTSRAQRSIHTLPSRGRHRAAIRVYVPKSIPSAAAALMRPIPPEAGHYRDKSAHPMDARMHPKGVRGPCCVR